MVFLSSSSVKGKAGMWNSSAQLYMCFNLYFYMAVVEWSNDSLQFELRGLEEV